MSKELLSKKQKKLVKKKKTNKMLNINMSQRDKSY